MSVKRIFQIAKELNISHTDILNFLQSRDVEINSHMSPVDEDIYQLIMSEFAKDKQLVDRFRKEQVRREIHDTRLKEQQQSTKKLQLLTLEEQRKLEKKELEEEKKKKQEIQKIELEKQQSEQDKINKKRNADTSVMETDIELDTRKKPQSNRGNEIKKKFGGPKKQKLRKINLSNIQSEIGQGIPRKVKKHEKEEPVHKSVQTKVKETLAAIETKKKKKSYKKTKINYDESHNENKDSQTTVRIPEFASVEELSKIFEVTASDIVQVCIELGMLVTINQRLDWDLIELLASHYGCNAEKVVEMEEELFSLEETEEDKEKAVTKAPVVTVMGHVDHGKTSLLDYIRNSNVVAGESGSITQHIGAYKVELEDEKHVTFLDTPGHEAFTAMRARGAQVTDIVILVVAADDAVMPQTIEAINHAKAANVPIIVAINKMDKPSADPDRVRRALSENDVLVENWGGKVQSVEISAKTGEGINDLLDSLLLETEVMDLKANKDCKAIGTVVDSRLDKGLGPIGTILIQKGTLKLSDPFMCNDFSGKVRAIVNERGQKIKEAGPSDAVQIQGFAQVPQVADILAVVNNEKDLKRISSERQRVRREIEHKKISFSLDGMSSMIKEGIIKTLPVIIKADVDGSVDVLSDTFIKLNTDEVEIKIIHKAVGMITESDVLLAEASNAVIVGFNVQVGSNAKLQANQSGVDIRTYNVIYNVVDELKLAMEGLLEPDKVETILGKAIVQQQFKIPKIGFIAGCKVDDGLIVRNAKSRLIRDQEIIGEGPITSLKRFKDDAREVKEGLECGIGIEGIKKYQDGDIIEVYEVREVKRKLVIH